MHDKIINIPLQSRQIHLHGVLSVTTGPVARAPNAPSSGPRPMGKAPPNIELLALPIRNTDHNRSIDDAAAWSVAPTVTVVIMAWSACVDLGVNWSAW